MIGYYNFIFLRIFCVNFCLKERCCLTNAAEGYVHNVAERTISYQPSAAHDAALSEQICAVSAEFDCSRSLTAMCAIMLRRTSCMDHSLRPLWLCCC